MRRTYLRKTLAALLSAAVMVTGIPMSAQAATDQSGIEEVSDSGTFQILAMDSVTPRGTGAHIRVITTGGVFVHKIKSTDPSTRMGLLAYGETAEIISTSDNWIEIYYHGYSAWVCGTTDTGEPLIEKLTDVLSDGYTELRNTEAIVTAKDGVNVHSVAGLQYKVIALLPHGTVVDALSKSDKWIRIKFKNGYTWEQGFIAAEWAKLIEKGNDTPAVSEETFKPVTGKNVLVKTNTKPLNVHLSPSANSTVIKTLPNGSEVTAVAQSPSWYEISYHDTSSGKIINGYVGKLFSSLVSSTGSARLNKTKRTITAGSKYQLAVLGLNALQIQNIKWKSANTKIATVSANGAVTAKKAGKVNVYAYYKVNTTTYRLKCVVTVKK
ncbi:MAG: SH3 domain-containing protein [Eubacteriales bacterium]|nr:SH3 domain-containing protein [Eubacteriales bacterium]